MDLEAVEMSGMRPERRQREVFYVLSATKGRLDDPNVVLVPISTHARYVEALQDSLPWHNKRGWHRVIQRHSMPFYAKAGS